MSQARLARVRSSHTREAVPELAGRRVRFLTLYVWFEDGIPIELSQTEASIIPFDDEGRRDQAAASLDTTPRTAPYPDDAPNLIYPHEPNAGRRVDAPPILRA